VTDSSILSIFSQLGRCFAPYGSCTRILAALVTFIPTASLWLSFTMCFVIATRFHSEATIVVGYAEARVIKRLLCTPSLCRGRSRSSGAWSLTGHCQLFACSSGNCSSSLSIIIWLSTCSVWLTYVHGTAIMLVRCVRSRTRLRHIQASRGCLLNQITSICRSICAVVFGWILILMMMVLLWWARRQLVIVNIWVAVAYMWWRYASLSGFWSHFLWNLSSFVFKR